jgi:hypothetical protein
MSYGCPLQQGSILPTSCAGNEGIRTIASRDYYSVQGCVLAMG